MTPVWLSRLQFAFTVSFHYIYPPISMGLGLMLVVIGIIYLRTKDPKWRRMSFFWIKIYGLVFAVGVATGVVQEFEFGTNWAEYSRFVGNIFGSLLAAEGVFAFFLEGGFLGLMLFGGNRLGPRMWLAATAIVAFGAHFSALWIVMANSWMQTPAGYEILPTQWGMQAFMTSFSAIVFTPSFIPRILHVWTSAWMVGAALMLSVSAFYVLRKRHLDVATANFKLAMPFFVVFSILQLFLFGANQAEEVANHQPVKLAAMEGVWEDTSCAPMTIVGIVDVANQTTYGIKIPCLLSFLAFQDIHATVQGLNSFPQENWPPIRLTFHSYHLMINFGMIFVAIGLLGTLLAFWKQKIWGLRPVLWLFVLTIFMAEAATIFGWWTAEFGRQPWIVWELMRTSEAVSPNLVAWQIASSIGMFVILYIILFILFIYLLNEKIQKGPESLEDLEQSPVTSLPDTFRDVFRRRARA
ncbi:MAG: cytochrome ubiquinol oxidase subunit I [Anaerolineae bacterium]|nr:cytochrome ubiquinol oxidase subunit I [Anaerolineae bacterium]MCB9133322.1 cytochrome ubiquinol oxidase subunit I [Anaerolineales bacterium]MCB0233288.1 cytochrome ubiquinol oxidase subunit I [Anaerolineae bacterium]MCB0237345.1 cytochrome ubiquinol oxidase subunit I [Anaerolineae bacterium]MCB0243529.1 cytochrome ubiquinol oxidase subunit I [Anaerolineae bacterium]